MKGKILLTLALCLALLTITGCAQKPQTEGISVVAVIFPPLSNSVKLSRRRRS